MPLKVLHCIHSLNANDGGPARSVPALADAEATNGAEVRVWSRQTPTIDLEEYRSAQFVTGDLHGLMSANWTPDLIHDHGVWLPSNHLSAKLARHNHVPRVVSPRGMLEPWCLQHHRYRKHFAWKLYQRRDLQSCTALHATSEEEAAQFRRLGLKQRIILFPNGVSLPGLHDPQPLETRSMRREIVFLSRIHPKKGLLNLIEAWKRVARNEWLLRIVGSDESGHRREIEAAITQNALADTVVVNDPVYSHKKWDLLHNADLVILPSFSENFGIVVAEALAVGTPVITTTGTPWENVLTERCGWYVEPNVQSLSVALQDAMDKSQCELKDMGERGGRWMRREYAWGDIGKNMLGAYEWLLGQSNADASDYIHKSPQRQAS